MLPARCSSLLLLASLAACSSAEERAPADTIPAPASAGVYSEIVDFAEVEASLPLLAERGLELYQVVPRDQIGSAALASLMQASAAQGVPFRAWLVLSFDDGYWPGESNVVPFGEALDELLTWIDQDQLPAPWITFDMEPSWAYTEEIRAIAADPDNPDATSELVALLKSHRDPAAFDLAREAMSALVDRVHGAGLKAHVVTYPLVIDDLQDGDDDIQDGLDIPVTGIAWDEVTFMMYRSVMQGFTPTPLTTHFFHDYALDAAASFGEAAGFDFGLVGTGLVTLEGSYEDVAVLREDVAASRAGGIERLHLYSFEGARAQSSPGDWLDFARVAPQPPPDDGSSAASLRLLFSLLDGLLGEP